MRIRGVRRRWARFTAIALLAVLSSRYPAAAAPPEPRADVDQSYTLSLGDPGRVSKVRLTLNKSLTMKTGRSYGEALIAQPEIADAVPLTDQTLYLVGKKIGLTHLTLLDREKRMLGVVELEVSFDVKGLREELERNVPGNDFRITTANGRIILGGVVNDAVAVSRAIAITEQFTAGCDDQSDGGGQKAAGSAPPNSGGASSPSTMPTLQLQISNGPQGKGASSTTRCFVNSMTVRAPQQVLLEVRFVEAQRTAARDLGFTWSARGSHLALDTGIGGLPSSNVPFGTFVARVLSGGTTVDVLIEALEKKGLARRLAEPNLVTLSGDTANFLAGGEFPFPVAADRDRITIEFKKFGIGLAFTPTVLSGDQINLKIEPEVSDLDPNNTILVSNTRIPSLVVRRANTTVELRDGQSFAIAGLLQATHTKDSRELPWIGEVPVLGALFRSASYEKKESDLVIIVTPRLVRPATPGQKLATPLDDRLPGNDRDFFLRGQLEVPKTTDGPFGHILDLGPVAVAPTGKVSNAYK